MICIWVPLSRILRSVSMNSRRLLMRCFPNVNSSLVLFRKSGSVREMLGVGGKDGCRHWARGTADGDKGPLASDPGPWFPLGW